MKIIHCNSNTIHVQPSIFKTLTFLWIQRIPTQFPEFDVFHTTADQTVITVRVELNVKYLQDSEGQVLGPVHLFLSHSSIHPFIHSQSLFYNISFFRCLYVSFIHSFHTCLNLFI